MNSDQFRILIKEVLPPLGYQWRRFDRRNTQRKIRRRMESLGIHDAQKYADLLADDPREKALFESLLRITITRFYRNAWLWSDLAERLLRIKSDPEGGEQTFSLWSAGCAGGEEAFSAAMLLDDLARAGHLRLPWSVLGTNTDPPSLERAASAQYNWGSVREVPDRIRRIWFTEENGQWILNRKLRNLVTILRHDLVREDPPGLFHAVLLRNTVLTYNTEEVQREVLEKIRSCFLQPAILVIGRTERVPDGAGFEEISKCIYTAI
jgi:chemotaxis methyl-accepting protein methylase